MDFPSLLLPRESHVFASEGTSTNNYLSHIPIPRLTSLEDEVEINMSMASRKGKQPIPHGEDSIRHLNHFDTISPISDDIERVFHDFLIVGETPRHIITP